MGFIVNDCESFLGLRGPHGTHLRHSYRSRAPEGPLVIYIGNLKKWVPAYKVVHHNYKIPCRHLHCCLCINLLYFQHSPLTKGSKACNVYLKVNLSDQKGTINLSASFGSCITPIYAPLLGVYLHLKRTSSL